MLRDEELYEGFTREEIDEIKAEAEARWGELYRESDRAVRRLTREALAEIKARGEAIEREVAAAAASTTSTKKGVTLDSVEVQALMARWVQHLKSFYEPTPEIVAGLGDLYVNDPRFRARYDGYGPGTAEFFRDALKTYAQSMPRT